MAVVGMPAGSIDVASSLTGGGGPFLFDLDSGQATVGFTQRRALHNMVGTTPRAHTESWFWTLRLQPLLYGMLSSTDLEVTKNTLASTMFAPTRAAMTMK